MNDNKSTAGLRTYSVKVTRQDEAYAKASSHDHTLNLGVRRGDSTAGFNATETLLAALGGCLITNVVAFSEKMRLTVDNIHVEIDGDRRDDPPALINVRYRLFLDSPESPEKLTKLHELAIQWGTVTNTLINGVSVNGELRLT